MANDSTLPGFVHARVAQIVVDVALTFSDQAGNAPLGS
jgi:hypothetical protein